MVKGDVNHFNKGNKKELNNAIGSNIHGPRDYQLSEAIQTERQLGYHLYVESKNIANQRINKTETDSKTQRTYSRLQGREGEESARNLGLTDVHCFT